LTKIDKETVVGNIKLEKSLGQAISIELLAAGITVDGNREQENRLSLRPISYNWNCHFPISGRYEISLIIRTNKAGSDFEVGKLTHQIKVVKLDGLTQRQIWLLATLSALITGTLGLAIKLKNLNLFDKILKLF